MTLFPTDIVLPDFVLPFCTVAVSLTFKHYKTIYVVFAGCCVAMVTAAVPSAHCCGGGNTGGDISGAGDDRIPAVSLQTQDTISTGQGME